jgi:chemotaxis family two-component system sensor kinase Cph1
MTGATPKPSLFDRARRHAGGLSIGGWGFVVGLVWSAVLLGSLAWSIAALRGQMMELAKIEARANFNKDQAFRIWATRHGGVYVPIDERTPPSPFMAHIPERDLLTPSGVRLTLMNPAYMLRQMMEEFADLYGVRGRITSLDPLRPQNAPDAWEREALSAFASGLEEVSAVTEIDGQPHLRLMRPMMTHAPCLKCHGHQGYKEGDIRGGVGISVPLGPYLAQQERTIRTLAATHGGIWLLGLGLIVFATQGARMRERERQAADARLRESERRLQGIVAHSSAVIFLKDAQGRFELVNHSWEILTGKNADEVYGKTDHDVFPAETAERLVANDRQVMETGQPLICEEAITHPDGVHTYVVVKFPILGPGGGVQGLCGIASDISGRKQMEEALRRSNAELEQFAYVASHDLREPLRMINSFLTLLERHLAGRLNAEERDYLRFARDGATRLDRLVLDLLDYSRVGRANQPAEPVDSRTALETALVDLRPAIAESGAAIALAPEMPWVSANADELARLFQNLIGNALKYREPERPLTVELTVVRKDYLWEFAVTDNGIGIPPEQRERVFRIFQRLHGRDAYGGGSGIGLAICRKIVERNGGKLWIDSKTTGPGTSFRFTLPAVDFDPGL